ncbi:Bifunctional aspartokinase/homoserine dehydrogenase C-terminal domain protein (plasmid) [Candidatus Trichorickettsia mobilis]|uniref:hypothetical protein n=1 Tax=Candidatus Trichorickettsia mobilis TaxID=1346319 RepID=UPI002B259147|nr:hypothetical protein [Candidatus Trichorickettsia mobilis]WPY01829.1 Bifunctional aspartokinase/homoserine dehydrogenase C-terminal domain protein [Candidatus Trichorickettsia mobilis]
MEVFRTVLHIATPNKKANSGSIEYYHALRDEANRKKRRFLYETNVGAGLPIFDTFKNLMNSGDKLVNFSGILSGSLSFIFGLLEEGMPFLQAVQIAREKKFTEPDPRDDLNGLDVVRKVLILSREIGAQYALEDIQLTPILPHDFDISGSIKQFLSRLSSIDSYFETAIKMLQKNNQVLRFVSEISENQCSVGMQSVAQDHPLYTVKGGENALQSVMLQSLL